MDNVICKHPMVEAENQLSTMDWYSWLSRTALESSLVYEYGLTLSRNELQKEDLAHFNHEFLQSMGISVAKHRLEILMLARKEIGHSPNNLSKFISATNRTRKCFNKCVKKLVHHENHKAIKSLPAPDPEPVLYQDQWSTGENEKELIKVEQRPALRTRKVAKSGPLDYRGREKLLVMPRSLKLSGPLDRKLQEKLVCDYRSPMNSGPNDRIAMARQERLMMLTNGRKSPKVSSTLDYVRTPSPKVYGDYHNKGKAGEDYDHQTLWAQLFQDMKPT